MDRIVGKATLLYQKPSAASGGAPREGKSKNLAEERFAKLSRGTVE